jgi:general secretion pathway protein G
MKLNHIKQNQTKSPGGFTLVEMLLVVAIIGILAALVLPRIVGVTDKSRITAAQADIKGGIKTALDRFEIDNGYYPRSFNDLIQAPSDAKHWSGPYLDQLPTDPWSQPYVYYYPGKHNQNGYDLLSVGPDGKEGTDDDIGNW